jgi:hypothetical protein
MLCTLLDFDSHVTIELKIFSKPNCREMSPT